MFGGRCAYGGAGAGCATHWAPLHHWGLTASTTDTYSGSSRPRGSLAPSVEPTAVRTVPEESKSTRGAVDIHACQLAAPRLRGEAVEMLSKRAGCPISALMFLNSDKLCLELTWTMYAGAAPSALGTCSPSMCRLLPTSLLLREKSQTRCFHALGPVSSVGEGK